MRRLLALTVTGVVALACGGGDDGGGGADAGGGGDQCVPGSPFDLNGTAGVLATLNVHVNASGLVETDTTAELLLLMHVTQSGQTVAVTATMCDIKIPEIPLAGQNEPVRFVAPPALIASVKDVMAAATLGGTQTCATFTSDPITIVLGARMDPPNAGTLPEADSNGMFPVCAAGPTCDLAIGSNCVCDQEDDGKPGATLLAMNTPAVDLAEVYVDLRTTFSLSGQVFSSDDIRGEVTATLEQGILDCLKSNGNDCSNAEVNAIKNINPDITQLENEPSTFRAVRVDAGLSCAQLIAMKGTLFPSR